MGAQPPEHCFRERIRISNAALTEHFLDALGQERNEVRDAIFREVAARGETELQDLVAASPVDEVAEAVGREPRAGIVGEPRRNRAAAALDENVGYRLGEAAAQRQGLQVRVAERRGESDEVVLLEDRERSRIG